MARQRYLGRVAIAYRPRRGVHDGSNLLAGLATGETSISDYNDLTVNGK
jgi:hypothetical protein